MSCVVFILLCIIYSCGLIIDAVTQDYTASDDTISEKRFAKGIEGRGLCLI